MQPPAPEQDEVHGTPSSSVIETNTDHMHMGTFRLAEQGQKDTAVASSHSDDESAAQIGAVLASDADREETLPGYELDEPYNLDVQHVHEQALPEPGSSPLPEPELAAVAEASLDDPESDAPESDEECAFEECVAPDKLAASALDSDKLESSQAMTLGKRDKALGAAEAAGGTEVATHEMRAEKVTGGNVDHPPEVAEDNGHLQTADDATSSDAGSGALGDESIMLGSSGASEVSDDSAVEEDADSGASMGGEEDALKGPAAGAEAIVQQVADVVSQHQADAASLHSGSDASAKPDAAFVDERVAANKGQSDVLSNQLTSNEAAVSKAAGVAGAAIDSEGTDEL
jgi:hypothetical protein